MNQSEINVGDIVCFKWDCLAGQIERTGKVTQIRKNNVEVYTETLSSNDAEDLKIITKMNDNVILEDISTESENKISVKCGKKGCYYSKI